MSDFYIPPLPDDFVEKVMKRIGEENCQSERQRIMLERLRNKMAHPKDSKQRKKSQ